MLGHKSQYLRVSVIMSICLIGLVAYNLYSREKIPELIQGAEYTILASNESGMHCIQSDYSAFMILPPGNTVRIQIFQKGTKKAKLITKGIIVEYSVNDNTTSADKNNFWQYAKDYGYDLKPGEGITGNTLSGVCSLSKDKHYFIADMIPVTPYKDNETTMNPYQTLTVTVKNAKSGDILAKEDAVVVPVSDEMLCSNCHGLTDTNKNILLTHDSLEGTNLYVDLQNGKRYKCSACHEDNSVSYVMHSTHAQLMSLSDLAIKCYNCHPGPVTQCNRGVMAAAGLECSNTKCHGNMENVAQSQKMGRVPWLEEPDCSNCHGELYASNEGKLYSQSFLMNGPDDMNGFITCITCHNSPHAEWPSLNPIDNILPIKVTHEVGFIKKCGACHEPLGNKIHGFEEGE
ncbi:cytochrome c3 family protein [Vallitalea maricola]|uniref:Uncharacterized protein n=1 Tax=Vallitalea maricola TaxID=3074433 RepID=A0ACB5UJ54_9FIRM|nr:hypothetical protein AN2V17_11780 [Vallitalea sp. AN17-2]